MMSVQIPLGELRPETLRQNPSTDWFGIGYDLFSFDDAESYRRILAAQSAFGRMEILAFIGIWCSDCQDHLPGFARILDAVKFPAARFRLYGLDRAKAFPGGAPLLERHAIRRLPTFVFLRDGQEIGRITEAPTHSLLKDTAAILSAGGA